MSKNLYSQIDKIAGELKFFKKNADLGAKFPQSLQNLLLNFSLNSLNPHAKNPLNFSDFPVDPRLSIPENLQEKIEILSDLSKKEKIFLPGLISEYFLEKSPAEGEKCRKKSGTFYTPSWIAEDMVKKSLEENLNSLLQNMESSLRRENFAGFQKEWQNLQNFKILDPACGWGIFLIEAYKTLEKFYKNLSLRLEKITPITKISQALCIEEILEICKNPAEQIITKHIYGYDINAASAKLARGILRALSAANRANFNIKEGDFIKILENPPHNFDLIIGNPPYFTIGGGGKGKEKTPYHEIIKNHSLLKPFFKNQSDIFYYFFIGSIEISKPAGKISFIIPSYWLENQHAAPLRNRILNKCHIEEIINFAPLTVFNTASGKKVAVDTLIIRARKNYGEDINFPNSHKFPAYSAVNSQKGESEKKGENFLREIREQEKTAPAQIIQQKNLGAGKWNFSPYQQFLDSLKKNMETIFPLGDISKEEREAFPSEFPPGTKPLKGICQIGQGQETGLSEIFLVSKKEAEKLNLEADLLKPNIKNSHIKEYYLEESNQFLILTKNEDPIENYPNLKKYLTHHKKALLERQRVQKGIRRWYAVSIPQNCEIFAETPKIVVPYRAAKNRFALDFQGHFNDGGDVRAITIKNEQKKSIDYHYLLGLLNCRLVNFWYSQAGKKKGSVFEYFTKPLARIPVRIVPAQIQQNIARQVKEICRLLSIKNLPESEKEINRLKNKVDETFFQIYEIPRKMVIEITEYTAGIL